MGVKKNFIYNSILTCSGYVFQLITYPYVSRVLGVTNIGTCNFVTSIVQYYIMFSTMGLSILGIREIARCKNDTEKLRSCFSSLFSINFVSTAIVLSIYILSILFVPKLYQYKQLLYVGGIQIILTPFLIEWFFTGIENFKYITIRSIFVKFVYVISVFIFVRKSDDYPLYFVLSCGMMVLNSIFNWNYRKHFVHFSFKSIYIRPYIKPFFILGIYIILTSMYTTFNIAYLGFSGGDKEVGYYTTATKLQTILLSLYTAFTNVMMPRISSLVADNNKEEIHILIKKSLNILYTFSFPLIAFSMIYAHQIIYILSGKGYEGAIIPLQIIMPLIFIAGINQILIIQILMPYKNDKAIFINSIIGALVGIILNIILIGKYKSIGSAIVLISSEIAVYFSANFFIKKRYGNYIQIKQLLLNILYMIPLFFILYILNKNITSIIYNICIGCLFVFIYVIILQYFVLKNQLIINMTDSLITKMRLSILKLK